MGLFHGQYVIDLNIHGQQEAQHDDFQLRDQQAQREKGALLQALGKQGDAQLRFDKGQNERKGLEGIAAEQPRQQIKHGPPP